MYVTKNGILLTKNGNFQKFVKAENRRFAVELICNEIRRNHHRRRRGGHFDCALVRRIGTFRDRSGSVRRIWRTASLDIQRNKKSSRHRSQERTRNARYFFEADRKSPI